MGRHRSVALLVESSRGYGRGLLRGIASYARTHRSWTLYYQDRALGEALPTWVEKHPVDGFIARLDHRRLVRQILEMGLPTVDLCGRHCIEGIPTFCTDDRAVARMAAEHLLDCGLRNFAYFGIAGLRFSDLRRTHFVEHLTEKGHALNVYEIPRPSPTLDVSTTEARGWLDPDSLVCWLRSLPKPVGLMAYNDLGAFQVLNACHMDGIAVPYDVAILGVDNDEVLCDLSIPAMSSIEPNAHMVGHEAAALLDRMISGQQPPTERTSVEPLRLVARQSTDVRGSDDPDLMSAVRFIRQHACEGITVSDVVDHVTLSPATLKRRFSKSLSRSPKAEILRVQLQRVKELLAMTDMPLSSIAEQAGFNHVEGMCKLFKKKTRYTPGQYRGANRNGACRGLSPSTGCCAPSRFPKAPG